MPIPDENGFSWSVTFDNSTMSEIDLDASGLPTEGPLQHLDSYPDTDATCEHFEESELKRLVGSTVTLVPQELQPSENSTEEVLKVSPSAAVGRTGIVTLSISTAVILASMALLAYLWAGQRNTSETGRLWRFVVTRSWLPQVVTLCTMALRWATAAQLCIFTSMLASIAVENFEVTLSQVSTVSVMRATCAEPRELLWALMQGNHYMLWGIRTMAMATVLLLLQATFQVSSTILLSDVGAGRIRGSEGSKAVQYGLSDLLQGDLQPYTMECPWSFKPPFWPSFAEYTEPAVEEDGIIDTGFVVRAFLPFAATQDRQSVANYSGNATLIAPRVSCFRPPLSDVAIHITAELAADVPGFVTGNIDFGQVQFELLGCQHRPCRGEDAAEETAQRFNCTLEFGAAGPSPPQEWTPLLCAVDRPRESNYFSRTANSYFGTGYLLLNVTGDVYRWNDIGRQNNHTVTNLTLSAETGWVHLDTQARDARLSATLCYHNQGPLNYYQVRMGREAEKEEPRFKWNEAHRRYDTAEVRKQLGVHDGPPSDHRERGILALLEWQAFPHRPKHPTRLLPEASAGSSLTLCRFCTQSTATTATTAVPVHHTLIALFQDVVLTTANPALALQALFTAASHVSYYSLLSEFNLRGGAGVTPFIAVLVPRRWTGFVVVAGLVAAHFVCGALVLVLFLKRCQCSMLGQAWRCIAQIRSGDTDVVLKQAAVATDAEIESWLKKRGKGETRVGILPWRRTGV